MFELNSTELNGEIPAGFDRHDFDACVCTIFNQRWTTSYSTFGEAVDVESCQPSDESFTE